MDVEVISKQKIPFLTLPPSATETRHAYRLLGFVMILARVNLFYAMTPVLNESPIKTVLD